ncbi:MAG: glycoside hydrolase family 97 C-terminal domain-containing protein, partial [bacterium]
VYELMVDIHDAYRPTGFSRTYPNLLTQEGIRGNEHMPTASHNTTLSFTRFPAGAGDYTICYYSDRIKPTHAHQLAMAVIVYSPLQFVFWYDKPSDYRGEPEVEFFEEIPSVWDETRVLQGEIGKYVVIARRSNNDWFLGIITNEQERELTVNLGFLHENREYNAYIYHDTQKTKENRTGVEIKEKQVTSSTSLKANLMARGGQAVRIVADR